MIDSITDSSRRLRIAYVCLVPDAGHLLPLVRIAAEVSRSDVDSLVVCPEEVKHLAAREGLDIVTVGPIRPDNFSQSLSALARSSPLQRKLYLSRQIEKHYFEPVQVAALRSLDRVKSALERFEPHLLVTDDHLFGGAYKWLAESSGVPLVLNFCAGSCFRILQNRPWRKPNPRLDAVVNLASRAIGSLSSRSEALFLPRKHHEHVERVSYLTRRWSEFREIMDHPNYPTERIGVGLGVLERKYLGHLLSLHSDMTLFPSATPLSVEPMSTSLNDWLDAITDTPVVYACFGSMTPARMSFGEDLLAACREVGARLLWVGKYPPGPSVNDSDWVRWERWAPQVEVLSHSAVRAFVSHAGGGSVQEAVWFGKPMLAIPFMWDQGYNSWVVEQLGFGLRMDKLSVTKREMKGGLQQLLHESRFLEKMESLSLELRAMSVGCEVSLHLQRLAGRASPWVPATGHMPPPSRA